MRAAEVGDELAHGEAGGGAIVDDGIVERASGEAAVVVRADGGQVGGCVGQFAGAGFARDLRLGELQQVGNADVWIMGEGHLFGVGERKRDGRLSMTPGSKTLSRRRLLEVRPAADLRPRGLLREARPVTRRTEREQR